MIVMPIAVYVDVMIVMPIAVYVLPKTMTPIPWHDSIFAVIDLSY